MATPREDYNHMVEYLGMRRLRFSEELRAEWRAEARTKHLHDMGVQWLALCGLCTCCAERMLLDTEWDACFSCSVPY